MRREALLKTLFRNFRANRKARLFVIHDELRCQYSLTFHSRMIARARALEKLPRLFERSSSQDGISGATSALVRRQASALIRRFLARHAARKGNF